MTYDRQRAEVLNADHRRRMDEEAKVLSKEHLDQDDASRTAIVAAMQSVKTWSGPCFILELGAGRGQDRDYLERTLRGTYTGVELVGEIAAQSEHVQHMAFEEAPASWNGRFDFIYSRHVMEHVLDLDLAMRTVKRLLAPGGIVGAVTPHYFPDPEPAHVTQLRLPQWIEAYTSHGLQVVHASVKPFACIEAHIVARRG